VFELALLLLGIGPLPRNKILSTSNSGNIWKDMETISTEGNTVEPEEVFL